MAPRWAWVPLLPRTRRILAWNWSHWGKQVIVSSHNLKDLKDRDYPLCTSLCTGELNATRKQNAFSAVLSTEGRVGGPCWEKLKPKGPKGSRAFLRILSTEGRGVCLWWATSKPQGPKAPKAPGQRFSAERKEGFSAARFQMYM